MSLECNVNNNLRQIKKISEHVRDHYVALLEAGQLVGVAVGGAEEALFDWDYNTLWGNRNGFAKLALSTGEQLTSFDLL